MKKILSIFILLCSFKSLYAKPIKVAIIDTGLKKEFNSQTPLCSSGSKDFTGEGFEDYHGHGTNITGLIVNNVKIKNYCIVIIKAFAYKDAYKNQTVPKQFLTQALRYAQRIHPDVINVSSGGFGSDDNEYKAVKKILDSKIKLVVSAGNNNSDLDENCNYFPACYDKRLFVVGNQGIYSNIGSFVRQIPFDMGIDHTAFGITLHGTSQSTALFSAEVINAIDMARKKK